VRRLIDLLRTRAGEEHGFTLVAVLGILMLTLLFTAASFQAVNGDSSAGRRSSDDKLAYAAAQAGLSWYQAQLAKDPSYWSRCTSLPQVGTPAHNAPVWDGMASTTATRTWGDVASVDVGYTGTPPADKQAFVVELVPANGQSKCVEDSSTSMIDSTTGTLRIRVIGRYGRASRALIGVFRRKGFLDFLYYSNYETLDAKLAPYAAGVGNGTRWPAQANKTFEQWTGDATTGCFAPYSVRQSHTYGAVGALAQYATNTAGTTWANWNPPPGCTDPMFGTSDHVDGPLHVVDPLLICGTVAFGTTSADRIEIEQPLGSHVRNANGQPGCASNANPTWNGTLVTSAEAISPPQSNDSLKGVASSCCRFDGKTAITLNPDGTMLVKNQQMGFPTGKTMNQPANGVIYASTVGTCSGYNPVNVDSSEDTCGNIRLQGQATQNLTFGADGDIVATGDLKPAPSKPNALIGLIAEGFVRVWHPVGAMTSQWFGMASGAGTLNNAGQCTPANSTGAGLPLDPIYIKAAILTLKHSFVVDNWRCGVQFGPNSLHVEGAIAQLNRGPVGCGTCRVGGLPAGYQKQYVYDPELKYRSPPNFLSPVQSAWRTIRIQEQGGAASISAGR